MQPGFLYAKNGRGVSYQDKGSAYTVWYADATTLNYWIATAKGAGISRVSLWRLGGNADIGKVK